MALLRRRSCHGSQAAVIAGTVLGGALSALTTPAEAAGAQTGRASLRSSRRGNRKGVRSVRDEDGAAMHVLRKLRPSAISSGHSSERTASSPTLSRSAATCGSRCTTGTCDSGGRSPSAGPGRPLHDPSAGHKRRHAARYGGELCRCAFRQRVNSVLDGASESSSLVAFGPLLWRFTLSAL